MDVEQECDINPDEDVLAQPEMVAAKRIWMECYKQTSKKVKGNSGTPFAPPAPAPIKTPEQCLKEKKEKEDKKKVDDLKKAAMAKSLVAATGVAAAAAAAAEPSAGSAAAGGAPQTQQQV